MKSIRFLFFAALPLVSSSSTIESRQTASQTAYVDLGVTRGKPEHLASGWIYGIPDNFPNQIPNSWYTDVGFRWGKGGGGQLGRTGQRGWVVSLDDYKG